MPSFLFETSIWCLLSSGSPIPPPSPRQPYMAWLSGLTGSAGEKKEQEHSFCVDYFNCYCLKLCSLWSIWKKKMKWLNKNMLLLIVINSLFSFGIGVLSLSNWISVFTSGFLFAWLKRNKHLQTHVSFPHTHTPTHKPQRQTRAL